MRCLVTGASGFLGAELIRQLSDGQNEVVALVRDPSRAIADGSSPLSRPTVAIAQGDITDRESMRGAMTGVDVVFHVAGWYHIGARDRGEAFQVNVEGTRNVMELARTLGVPKVVYTSSLAVFSDTHGRVMDESYHFGGKHISVYDLTKWMAHYEVALPLARAGLPLVIVQPGAVYGPGDKGPLAEVIRLYLRRELPMVARRAAYCWGHVADVARAHILAMEKGRTGESYIIAGPCHELIEVLQKLQEMTGVPLPRRADPRFLRAAAALLRLLEHVHPLNGNYSAESLRVFAGVTYLGTNAKARRELGIEMRPLEEGLQEALPWYVESARRSGE